MTSSNFVSENGILIKPFLTCHTFKSSLFTSRGVTLPFLITVRRGHPLKTGRRLNRRRSSVTVGYWMQFMSRRFFLFLPVLLLRFPSFVPSYFLRPGRTGRPMKSPVLAIRLKTHLILVARKAVSPRVLIVSSLTRLSLLTWFGVVQNFQLRLNSPSLTTVGCSSTLPFLTKCRLIGPRLIRPIMLPNTVLRLSWPRPGQLVIF